MSKTKYLKKLIIRIKIILIKISSFIFFPVYFIKVKYIPVFCLKLLGTYSRNNTIIRINTSEIKNLTKYKYRAEHFFNSGLFDKDTISLRERVNQFSYTDKSFAFSLLSEYLLETISANEFLEQHKKPIENYFKNGGFYAINERKIRNFSQLEDYFTFYKRIMESIVSNGFQQNPKDAYIGVAIGRNKELLKYKNGRHRFLIASILDLKDLPVEVKLIHTESLKPYKNMILHKAVAKLLADVSSK
jgi:hypothetical protein